jgi:tRNA pseudouridine55 synthase
VIVDKPAGPTSHDVVDVVRRATGTRRVGHAGTLDPFASGVLPVLTGRATRLATYLMGLAKHYAGILRLGVTTDTDDRTGTVLRVGAGWEALPEDAVAEAMAALTGPHAQLPPVYSAKKVGGVPAHRRARRGQDVTLAARDVTIHAFASTGRDGPDVAFTAHVSSGTYVRALARDLGARLGCGAHLVELRRTAVGPWTEPDAVPLDRIVAPFTPAPALDAVPHLPRRPLNEDEALGVRHGRTVAAGDAPDGPCALVENGALLAVADRQGDQLVPRVVLAG